MSENTTKSYIVQIRTSEGWIDESKHDNLEAAEAHLGHIARDYRGARVLAPNGEVIVAWMTSGAPQNVQDTQPMRPISREAPIPRGQAQDYMQAAIDDMHAAVERMTATAMALARALDAG